jgi:hypothetical protein
MVDGDIEFRDEFEDNGEKTLSIKEIILRHIRKISDLSCQEFTGGYWEKKPIKTPSGIMFTESYKQDVREAYCNAIDFLVDIIYPMSDNDLKEYLQKFEGFKEKIEEEDRTEDKKLDIVLKIKLKRQTFRQINLMFERKNFWKGTGSYSE